MTSVDYEPALPEPAPHSTVPASPDAVDSSLLSDHPVASSPVMRDLGLEPPRFASHNPHRDSRASSFRLSKDLNNLKWDISQLREGDSTAKDQRPGDDVVEPDSEVEPEQTESDGQQGEPEQSSAVTYSTLSKRADFILANAKKKLSLLEGNLGRARHSLMANPQTVAELRTSSSLSHYAISGSGGADDSPTSPQGPRAIMGPRINFGTPRTQRTQVPASRSPNNTGHSRMYSDTSVPMPSGASVKGSRSLDYMRDGNNVSGHPLREASNLVEKNGNSSNSSLSPVAEDEPPRDESPGAFAENKRSSILAIRELYGHSSPLPKSTQELRDQAEDLRERIAFLHKRSRDDRARGAFDSSNPQAERDERVFLSQVQALEKSLEDQEEVIEQLENAEREKEEIERDPRGEWQQVLRKNEERDDGSDANSEDLYDDDFEDEWEGREVPDALEGEEFDDTKTMDGAHEDRVDAFDYEHFILHSVMGRINPTSPSGSDTGSEGREYDEEEEEGLADREYDRRSTGSASTERAGGGEEMEQQWDDMQQSNESMASLATMQSFETAQERGDSASDDGSYGSETHHEGLLHSDGLPGMWPMPPNSERDAASEAPTPRAASFPSVPVQLEDKAVQAEDKGLGVDPRRRPTSTVFSVLMKPDSETAAMIPGPIGAQDTALVRQVVESLRTLCLELHQAGANPRELKQLRERLEVSKRVLTGEL